MRLGLGLAALGRPAYLNLGHGDDVAGSASVAGLQRRAHEVLDAAWAAGIRHFDAARSYGRAEDFLASWLPGREGARVSSKWGYVYTADWRADAAVHEVKDHSLANLRRQWPESRARLGGALWLYQVHSATLESGVLSDPAVHAELGSLGVRIGLSLSGPRQAEALRVALENPVFSAVQATWNLLEPSCGPALAEAKARGWFVIVKEALANGRLGPRGDVAALKGRAEPPDALALAAALAQPWADLVLSGAATVAQLRSNLRALEIGAPDLEIAEADYWERRSRLPWT